MTALEKTKREKNRQCIGCREIHPKQDMIRIIRTPEGNVEIDETGKKNGRGAYLCRNKTACLLAAQKKKALERSLKMPVSEDIFERLMESIKNETDA